MNNEYINFKDFITRQCTDGVIIHLETENSEILFYDDVLEGQIEHEFALPVSKITDAEAWSLAEIALNKHFRRFAKARIFPEYVLLSEDKKTIYAI